MKRELEQEKMHLVYEKIKQLITIVNELESEFEGRKFTLDGHLVGSIGEVLAAYYYGLKLLPPSAKTHDAISEKGRNVQIKITQGKSVLITSEPEYLIILYLDRKTGKVFEVYNGCGKEPWDTSYSNEEHNYRRMSLTSLSNIDTRVQDIDRIEQIYEIPKYKKEIKEFKVEPNIKEHKEHKKRKAYSTKEGFINVNNQINIGKTDMKGTDFGQWFYQLECLTCHHKYLTNGSNISAKRCPICK
jgi:hypothetical protein